MNRLNLYYDFISPFCYLFNEQIHRLPDDIEINYIPVLFAGLLKHWGSLGPVEIKRKKTFTYRYTTWLAEQADVPFRTPDTHPFNPLPYLRLSIAMDNDPELVTKIFRAIWTTNNDPATDEGRQAIWDEVAIPHADSLTSEPKIKATLIENTRQATEQGVFGVPTVIANGELFWGLDSLDLLLDYLARPELFSAPSMKRLEQLNYGTKR